MDLRNNRVKEDSTGNRRRVLAGKMCLKSCLLIALMGLSLVCNEATLVDGHVLVFRRVTNQVRKVLFYNQINLIILCNCYS